MREIHHKLRVARGEAPADLLFKNANIVNVFSGEIHRGSVAVCDGRIIGFGDYDSSEVIDLEGAYLCPGFIDGHMHVESTMLTVPEFARAVVPLGTSSIVIDPHEIANVLGLDGIRYILESSLDIPLDVFVMLPSCVPATSFETAGAKLTSYDLSLLIKEDRVVGVGEMMNFPGAIYGDPEVLKKIDAALWKKVDGHAPGVSGKFLNAYVLNGIYSDHECTTLAEARDKLRLGMHILLREGTSERNLDVLLPLVTPHNAANFSLASDDKHPTCLMNEGHINYSIKKVIKQGVAPVNAIQMATINTARHYRLRNIGGIAPRYWADFVVFDNFNDFNILKVYKKGKLVARQGEYLGQEERSRPVELRSTMNASIMPIKSFKVPAEGKMIRVIGLVPHQIVTEKRILPARIVNGEVCADPERDLLKMVVVERHRSSGNLGIGFVQGFGFKEGAIASSVAHDSHNILVVGSNDDDMSRAVLEVIRLQGGFVVVKHGQVLASFSLPIAGLMSDQPLETVYRGITELVRAAHEIGCPLENPFMTLSFLALTPIPALKLSDKGLFDVEKFQLVPLFADSPDNDQA